LGWHEYHRPKVLVDGEWKTLQFINVRTIKSDAILRMT